LHPPDLRVLRFPDSSIDRGFPRFSASLAAFAAIHVAIDFFAANSHDTPILDRRDTPAFDPALESLRGDVKKVRCF
jgi:hypothetical protein